MYMPETAAEEYERKSKSDQAKLAAAKPGDVIMTADKRKWVLQADGSLKPDFRNRRQRRRDGCK